MLRKIDSIVFFYLQPFIVLLSRIHSRQRYNFSHSICERESIKIKANDHETKINSRSKQQQQAHRVRSQANLIYV